MLTLRYNPASERYDCYDNGEYVSTLTCGTRFNLYADDEDIFVLSTDLPNNQNEQDNETTE